MTWCLGFFFWFLNKAWHICAPCLKAVLPLSVKCVVELSTQEASFFVCVSMLQMLAAVFYIHHVPSSEV